MCKWIELVKYIANICKGYEVVEGPDRLLPEGTQHMENDFYLSPIGYFLLLILNSYSIVNVIQFDFLWKSNFINFLSLWKKRNPKKKKLENLPYPENLNVPSINGKTPAWHLIRAFGHGLESNKIARSSNPKSDQIIWHLFIRE